MRLIFCSVLLSSVLFLSGAAAAQEQDKGAQSPDIVVTGDRIREQHVREFIGALTRAPEGSIPRLIDAVCPAASGLPAPYKEAVAKRLREVAAAAGLKLAGRGCAPNLFVIVTPNKRAFIELLAEKRPESFGMMTAQEVRRLARSPGPAAAWQTEGPVDSSGVPYRYDEQKGQYVHETTDASSRLTNIGHQGFDTAALVVEAGALEGLTATQLADYAAMRLLAKVDPAKLPAKSPPTILTALTTPMGSAVPLSMTKWDLSFLRGLYATPANLLSSAQRSRIATEVLGKPKKAARQGR